MCYLVSSMPPPSSNGIRTHQITVFEDDLTIEGEQTSLTPLEQAQRHAAGLLLAGSTNVKLWKIVDAPVLTQAVQWPKLDQEPPTDRQSRAA